MSAAAPAPEHAPAGDRRIEVLHRDDRLAVVAKPSGLLVHRSDQAPDRDSCLARLHRQLGRFVWPVHRLDRGASGALAFALDAPAARQLAAAFAQRQVRKTYLAVVRGFVTQETLVEHPLGRDAGRPPRPAVTRVFPLARVELPYAVGRYATARYTLLRVEPHTGRGHQIRRHLRHLRHPLVGDVTYGDSRHNRFFRERFGLGRLLLHAWRLALPHPGDGSTLSVNAPVPPELRALFDRFGWLDALTALQPEAA